MFRRPKPTPLNPAIGLDRETVSLTGREPTGPVTPIPDWDVKHPVDPVSVLPGDLTPYFDQIDALISGHAHNGTLDEATPDLLDRLINDWARGWEKDINRAVHDGLEIHDLIVSQGTEHLVSYGQRIAPLRDDLGTALQQREAARATLTGGTRQPDENHDLPEPQTLPQPWLPRADDDDQEQAS